MRNAYQRYACSGSSFEEQAGVYAAHAGKLPDNISPYIARQQMICIKNRESPDNFERLDIYKAVQWHHWLDHQM